MLFIGVTTSLATVPTLLEKIDSVTNASRQGRMNAPAGDAEARTQALLDRAQRSAGRITDDPSADRVSRVRPSDRGVTRVLGPDDDAIGPANR